MANCSYFHSSEFPGDFMNQDGKLPLKLHQSRSFKISLLCNLAHT